MSLDDILLCSIKNDDLELLTDAVVCGADINEQDEDGMSPLTFALDLNKDAKIIKRLVELGVDVNIRDKRGITPLMYGLHFKKSVEVIDTLINAGADVNAYDDFGIPCLMFVRFDYPCTPARCYGKEIVMLLLKNGADVLTVSLGGDSILHKASCLCVLELLLSYKISLEIKNFDGHTPLMAAVIQNNIDKVKNLLSLGADPNCKDVNLNTPLHVARSCAIVNLLLYYGANMNVINTCNETPLVSLLKENSFSCHSKFLCPLLEEDFTEPSILDQNCNYCESSAYTAMKHAILTNDNCLFRNELREILVKLKNFKHFFLFVKKCRIEIKDLQTTFINDKVTFYELCVVNELKLNEYLDICGSEFKFTHPEIKNLFPCYCDFIVMKLEYYQLRAKERMKHQIGQ